MFIDSQERLKDIEKNENKDLNFYHSQFLYKRAKFLQL